MAPPLNAHERAPVFTVTARPPAGREAPPSPPDLRPVRTKVIVLELLPRLLASEDEAVSQAIRDHLEHEGLEIHTSVTAFRVERDGRDLVIHGRLGSLTGGFRAERLLVATGRRANTADLGLEAAGVQLTANGFIEVDATLRTANPDVYAAGDVAAWPGFVYVAAAGGRVAALNALTGAARELDLSAVPSVTFTSPQVASVGITEAKARSSGYHVEVSTLDLEHVPRALVSHDRRGLVKVVAEARTGRVLGVHAVGPHAGELMGEAYARGAAGSYHYRSGQHAAPVPHLGRGPEARRSRLRHGREPPELLCLSSCSRV